MQLFFRFLCFIIFFTFSSSIYAVENPIHYYVAPNGDDNNDGTLSSPFKSLEKARDTIRATRQSRDYFVHMRGGEYVFTKPFELHEVDSGYKGFRVTYTNYKNEKPIISGGFHVSNWEQQGAIWKSQVGTGREFRQFYVNGVRAIRARSPGPLEGQSVASDGFLTSNMQMANWQNQSAIELVGNKYWKQYRCPVASISPGRIQVVEPCFSNSQAHTNITFSTVDYVENAFELLDAPGEWYYNKQTGWIYYIPRANEPFTSSSQAVIPTIEQFIIANGTPESPLLNISIQGIEFEYATWNRPSDPDGWVEIQANFVMIGYGALISTHPYTRPEAAIHFENARNIIFTNNTISRIGSAAINFGINTQNNQITLNDIHDISSIGILLGDIYMPRTTDPKFLTIDNTIAHNMIYEIGKEFQGAVGIWAGYTVHTTIAHNTLFNLPYSGISIGWGWGSQDPTVARDNIIEHNLVFNHVQSLMDGGGIYSLSAQPGNIYRNNVILNQSHDYGAMYLDDKSRYITVENNIIFNNLRTALIKGGDNIIQNNFWQDRYSNDIYKSPDPLFGQNSYINNLSISNLNEAPTTILTNVGAAPVFTAPDSSVIAGDVQISWKPQVIATKYLLRINDLADPMVCAGVSPNGDVCIETTTPNYTYNFKPGHSYTIWVHAVNGATLTYGPPAVINVTIPTQNTYSGIEFMTWLLHYGQTVDPGTNGDFDQNGIIDFQDYTVWKTNYAL